MNNGQKKMLIIIGIVLLITSIFAVILSFKTFNNEETPSNKPNNNETGNENSGLEIGYEIAELKNEKLFFNIQNTINKYYINLSNKNIEEIYKVLEEDYKKENGITKNNLTNKIYSNYETVNYVVTEIYYNKFSVITYYFVSGYLFNATMMSDSYDYNAKTNFILITKDDEYVLKPLEDNIDIKKYAENYNIKDIEINSNEELDKINVTEKNKLTIYINEFLNLLYLDTQRAYNMLDETTKNKYLNYYDFEMQIDSIYNSISSNIFAYSIVENKNNIIYKIKDKSQNTILITEYNVMNYKIGF